ncbi:hypothetical protein DWB63_03195 [Pseudodesulfovibrio sp. S3]|nr:hypothetical protein DWB63_03195 [Pseudodesulfovibrio sp. S3]
MVLKQFIKVSCILGGFVSLVQMGKCCPVITSTVDEFGFFEQEVAAQLVNVQVFKLALEVAQCFFDLWPIASRVLV